MCLFLCLSSISLGQYWCKDLPKSGGFKKYKKGDGHIEGLSIEWGIQTFSTLWYWETRRGGLWSPELLRGSDLKGEGPQTPLHTILVFMLWRYGGYAIEDTDKSIFYVLDLKMLQNIQLTKIHYFLLGSFIVFY